MIKLIVIGEQIINPSKEQINKQIELTLLKYNEKNIIAISEGWVKNSWWQGGYNNSQRRITLAVAIIVYRSKRSKPWKRQTYLR